VGAGPGDPDLVTLKALEALGRADVILYDRLVSPEILARGRRDAERIYVGKHGYGSQVPQDETTALLAELARAGKTVVRLKGGDPFIFGRGGEEVLELVRQGIAVHVIPGITAALGCAAAARIPLTHRATARAVTFATARTGSGELLESPSAAGKDQTWVIYMGGRQLEALTAEFIRSGLDSATPAAVIADGTRATQQVVYGSLANIGPRASSLPPDAPSLLIVGRAVQIGAQIAATSERNSAAAAAVSSAASAA
jgi:uroporphyrin-III C-methyltransferase